MSCHHHCCGKQKTIKTVNQNNVYADTVKGEKLSQVDCDGKWQLLSIFFPFTSGNELISKPILSVVGVM